MLWQKGPTSSAVSPLPFLPHLLCLGVDQRSLPGFAASTAQVFRRKYCLLLFLSAFDSAWQMCLIAVKSSESKSTLWNFGTDTKLQPDYLLITEFRSSLAPNSVWVGLHTGNG